MIHSLTDMIEMSQFQHIADAHSRWESYFPVKQESRI